MSLRGPCAAMLRATGERLDRLLSPDAEIV
jgi:hypothetical protein